MFKFHITINQTVSLETDGGQKVHHCAPSDHWASDGIQHYNAVGIRKIRLELPSRGKTEDYLRHGNEHYDTGEITDLNVD
jgi:hypothetical protein